MPELTSLQPFDHLPPFNYNVLEGAPDYTYCG